MADHDRGATLGGVLAEARRRLAGAGIGDGALDARLLVENATGTTRIDAISMPDRAVLPDESALLEAALRRRIAGEPVHRILGYREFYGLRLSLSRETLEPRADTEVLVDLCLSFLRQRAAMPQPCRILDLGTGTGAVGLAILSQVRQAIAVATDVSEAALETALANAAAHGLERRFEGLKSDWFADVGGRFALIVSNPPYITSSNIAMLGPEVRCHDPRRALDGGEDGLDAYRAIASGAADHLDDGGRVAVETGFDQKSAVVGIFEDAGFSVFRATKDFGGRDRALMFCQ